MPSTLHIATGRALLGGAAQAALPVPGAILWVAANLMTGFGDGDAVGTWKDLSGGGNNLVQATGSQQPLYKTNVLNGRPTVRFDGVDDRLAVTAALIGTTTHYTLIVAAMTTTTTGTRAIFATGTAAVGYAFQLRQDGTTWNYYQHDSGSDINATEAAGVTANQWDILTAQWDGSNLNLWRDGNAKTGVASTDNGRASTSNSVGDDEADGSLEFWQGDIAELAIYSTPLSAADRQAVERYMGTKYAITVA